MRPSRRSLACLILAATTCAGGFAIAQDKSTEAAGEQIRAATTRFVEAFNSGDARRMSEFWTPHGDFVGENGQKFNFREHVAARPQPTKSDNPKEKAPPRPSLMMTVESIRFVTPDVATVDGVSVFKNPGATATHGRYTATWVRSGDKGLWLLDSVRENHVASGLHHAHLMELAWLVGDWTEDSKEPRIQSEVRWSADGNYLERTFTGKLPGRLPQSGVQRIGWDPKRGQFRSWTFAHDGSFSQGLWEETEKGWNAEISGVTADGRSTGSLNKLTRLDDNAILWESVEATMEGEPLPDLKLKLIRKPAK